MAAARGETLMTAGSVGGQIIRFAMPVFWGNLFQQLYNLVDALVVGNFLGSEALAAVGTSGNIIFLLVGLLGGIFTGAGVDISNAYGAGDEQAMRTAVHTTVAFGLIAGVLLSVAGVLISPPLLRWVGTPEMVFPQALLYFRIYFAGALFVALYNTAMGIFQAVGDSRHPLYYLIVSSVINVVLDLLFVAVFHMGVDGAALATVISQAVSAALGFRRLMHTDGPHRLFPRQIRLHGPTLRRVLSMGLPSGLQNSIISIGNIFVQSGINRYGAMAMAGSGAYWKLEGFGFLPVSAFALALTTFTGQNLGAKKYARARQGARFGLAVCMAMSEVIGVLTYWLSPYLISLFNGDPEVIRYGAAHARTIAFFYFLLAFSHGMAGILRGAGKSVVPMLVMSLCWCAVRVVYIPLIAARFSDVRMVYIVYPITWTLSSVAFLIYYFKADWIHGLEGTGGEGGGR